MGKIRLSSLTGLLICFVLLSSCSNVEDKPQTDWKDDWEVAEGFAIEIDSLGFELPTSITFVENPGPSPKDPLYFVTELEGKIKVVSNDRSVFTFAEGFSSLDPNRGYAGYSDQYGLTGLCLDPANGYVFATLAYPGSNQHLYNQIIRFSAPPKHFALKPTAYEIIAPFLEGYPVLLNHQIGACQVVGEQLFVGVGDGQNTAQSLNLNSPQGKILRLSLDGEPLIDNPFAQDDNPNKPINYIWAYGFRNPFGLFSYNERIFITDNGIDTDRFAEVQPGENFLWSGNDVSIKANADFVISPALSPTHLVYVDEGAQYFPEEMRNAFYIALAGKLLVYDELPKPEGIYQIKYDLETASVSAAPTYFLRNREAVIRPVVAIASGKDGLYFSSMLPNDDGEFPVYKIYYSPTNSHPYAIHSNPDPRELIRTYGCLNCHSLAGRGVGSAPNLDYTGLVNRLEKRLDSPEYLGHLNEIDNDDLEDLPQWIEFRDQVRNTDMHTRVEVWIAAHLLEPRFDNDLAQMPDLEMSEIEAKVIANYLTTDPGLFQLIKDTVWPYLPSGVNWHQAAYAFTAGAVFTFIFYTLILYVKKAVSTDKKSRKSR